MIKLIFVVSAAYLTLQCNNAHSQNKNPGPAGSAGQTRVEASSQASSLDDRRKQDLQLLDTALRGYAKQNGGVYLLKGSGYGGTGIGFINYKYDAYPTIVEALHAKGLLKVRTLEDPAGGPSYMLYLCDNDRRYSLSATLDRPSPAELAQAKSKCNGTGVNGTVDNYKKNYSIGN